MRQLRAGGRERGAVRSKRVKTTISDKTASCPQGKVKRRFGGERREAAG